MTVVELSTPRNLLDAVEREGRHPWLATLPTIVEQVAEHWSLKVGGPFQPGGQTAWVAPVRGATGAALVLKVAWCHPEAEHEADGLREWDGDGAVRLGQCLEFGLVRPPTTIRGALEPRAGPEPRPVHPTSGVPSGPGEGRARRACSAAGPGAAAVVPAEPCRRARGERFARGKKAQPCCARPVAAEPGEVRPLAGVQAVQGGGDPGIDRKRLPPLPLQRRQTGLDCRTQVKEPGAWAHRTVASHLLLSCRSRRNVTGQVLLSPVDELV